MVSMIDGLFRDREQMAHAYVIQGPRTETIDAVMSHVRDVLGIETVGNPDVFVKDCDRLGIDDVRTLGELQSRTAVGADGYKLFVVAFDTVTVEAQNAMLKMLEEPTPGTVWLVVTPGGKTLLPTVLSRVQLVEAGVGKDSYGDMAREFVALDYLDREKMLKQFAADPKKDIPANRLGLRLFVQAVATIVFEQRTSIDNATVLYRELEAMADYASDRSSSVKHIGDYVAIRVPQVSGL